MGPCAEVIAGFDGLGTAPLRAGEIAVIDAGGDGRGDGCHDGGGRDHVATVAIIVDQRQQGGQCVIKILLAPSSILPLKHVVADAVKGRQARCCRSSNLSRAFLATCFLRAASSICGEGAPMIVEAIVK
jgi:hypothetical protein